MSTLNVGHVMANAVRLQQTLNVFERVVMKMVAGECICQEPEEGRRGFRCPVHHEH
jgi:hypothetical protein